MNIGAAFPSKYVRAADLPDGKFITVVIDRVEQDNVAGNGEPEEYKPVLFFQGKEKGLVLNKTNANTIAAVYGQETDHWIGRPVQIYSTETQYGAKMVPCIRVKIPKMGTAPQLSRPTVGNGGAFAAAPSPPQPPPPPPPRQQYQPQPSVWSEEEQPAAVAGRLPPEDDIPF